VSLTHSHFAGVLPLHGLDGVKCRECEGIFVSADQRGILFIVSSPSGGGKTTLIREAIARLGQRGIEGHFSVSHTTRPPRPAESNAVDYHFVDDSAFEAMVQQGEFLEWAEYAGYRYGTSRAAVDQRLADGEDVFLDIEVQGANQVKTLVPDVVKVFVYPPSYEVLKHRLAERRQDDPETIRRRLQWALGEFRVAGEFDYAIINDRLEEAVDALFGICLAEHQKSTRMNPQLDAVRTAFQNSLEKDFT
jgi:guanylate kinase